ncbi:MAG: DUF3781 domain-containing protein [Lachnospiraceae bacterium]
MDNCRKERLIEDYFRMWVERDFTGITDIFAPEIYYSECYGPEYQGHDEIRQWIGKMLKDQVVLEWSIKRFIHQRNTVVVEWLFRDRCNDAENQFNGVSIIEFNSDGTIYSIKEFASAFEYSTSFRDSVKVNGKDEVLVDSEVKSFVLDHLCYTELVFERINKKLKMSLSPEEIRGFIYSIVMSEDCTIYKRGKNYYACNDKAGVQITINSFNCRVITADSVVSSIRMGRIEGNRV